MVACACNPITWEAEAGGSPVLKQSAYTEILCIITKQNNKISPEKYVSVQFVDQ